MNVKILIVNLGIFPHCLSLLRSTFERLPCALMTIPMHTHADCRSRSHPSLCTCPATTSPSPLKLRTLHRQKLAQPLQRLLRLRRRQMLHRFQQMRRDILIQIHPRGAAMRYRLRRRLLSWRTGIWAIARRRWRRGLDDWRRCRSRRCCLDRGLEGGGVERGRGGGVCGLLEGVVSNSPFRK